MNYLYNEPVQFFFTALCLSYLHSCYLNTSHAESKDAAFLGSSMSFSECSTDTSLHLPGLPLGPAPVGLGHEEGSVGVQRPHAEDSWEGGK